MPRIVFAAALQRHVASPPVTVAAASVREALDAAFVINPRLKSYILDDQDRLRKHMTIFVDGTAIRDRSGLSDTITEKSEIYVLQALSGG